MKVCPECKTQYSDDTLRFCLQDGTPLVEPFDPAPTLVMNRPEIETDPRGRRIDIPVANDDRNPPPPGTNAVFERPVKGRSRTPITIAATALGMLLLFGIGGLGAWLYFSNRNPEAVNSSAATNTQVRNTNAYSNVNMQPPPSATKTASSPNANGNSRPPQNVDHQAIKQEVTQKLMGWRSETEALDIDSYMAHYAPTVDYYNRSGVSAAYVRTDKQRAFSRFDAIRMDISKISVTSDPSGDTATAVFDKEWEFSGERNSSGKVRQMIRFRNINGEWLITAEKDLKVYYTR
jgi:hypothetical protein